MSSTIIGHEKLSGIMIVLISIDSTDAQLPLLYTATATADAQPMMLIPLLLLLPMLTPLPATFQVVEPGVLVNAWVGVPSTGGQLT